MTITIQRAHGGAGGAGGVSRVTFSPVAIAEFNRTWPGSKLGGKDSDSSLWFEFGGLGNHVGSNMPYNAISESLALCDDARELLLTGDRPAWARFSEIVDRVDGEAKSESPFEATKRKANGIEPSEQAGA